MKNWTRIAESYVGGFTEMYLDLYKCNTGLVIKGTSYHYNAGAEKLLCEVKIPAAIQETEEVLHFIAETHSSYPWAKITLEELKSNKDLIAFIKENR